ncbi:unnamed protein product [Trichobilharzia regenti]|nr:unnamed protein product [Trichobilharzia regenti]
MDLNVSVDIISWAGIRKQPDLSECDSLLSVNRTEGNSKHVIASWKIVPPVLSFVFRRQMFVNLFDSITIDGDCHIAIFTLVLKCSRSCSSSSSSSDNCKNNNESNNNNILKSLRLLSTIFDNGSVCKMS